MDGEAFLRRYIEQHDEPGLAGDDRVVVFDRAQIAAEALVSVGAIEEQRAIEILADLRERLDTGEEEGLFVGGGPRGAQEEHGPYEWGDMSRFPPAPRLYRVIPVVMDGLIDDVKVTVISVEIWSDHFTIRSVVTAEAYEISRPQ